MMKTLLSGAAALLLTTTSVFAAAHTSTPIDPASAHVPYLGTIHILTSPNLERKLKPSVNFGAPVTGVVESDGVGSGGGRLLYASWHGCVIGVIGGAEFGPGGMVLGCAVGAMVM